MSLGKINLITPPDKLFNLNVGYLLVKPSTKIKMQFQQILTHCNNDVNVYIFDDAETDIEWMLSVSQHVDVIIIDVDNCDPITKNFISFMLAQPNAFYLTNDELTPWKLISRNRIYDLNWLLESIAKELDDEDEDDNDESGPSGDFGM
jgi:hypothetical protein